MLNLENDYKNYNCNSLTIKNIGEKVYLQGWVKAKRDHGELVFIDLYDFYGMTQLTCENTNVNLINSIKNLPRESVIAIQGKVVKRSENSKNIKIITGEIEIAIESMEILNKSLRLPFELHESNTVNEEICFQYRFLQLRGGLNQIMYLRSNIVFQIRQFMHSKNFIEVETPILTGPSEEGARDFVVPSRLHKGKFYALPQAPQIFKQLTMVGGLPKYYQIAKCFRDEDLRRDRSLEFTQLDIEIAFATKDQIFAYIEELMQLVFKLPNKSFRRIQYNDAMNLYGTDKPDLRNPLILQDITDLLLTSGLNMFVNNIKDNKAVAK
ncbi:MAG: amino acid--tRNA ligase-related protein, partial [Pseudomonadota bacterium]